MNSLGNSSKWPSYDSLPSTSSFLLSETEQTEDEAEAFSEGEGDSGMRKSPSADEGISLSGSYLGLAPHTSRLRLRAQCERVERCSDKTHPPDSAPSPEDPTLSSSVTPGDIAFAQKVSTFLLGSLGFILVNRFYFNCINSLYICLFYSSVQICIGLSILCLSCFTDYRLGDLTEVCDCVSRNHHYLVCPISYLCPGTYLTRDLFF